MRVEPAAALVGDVAVPGTKSISHRALLFGAIADGDERDPQLRLGRRHRVDGRARCARWEWPCDDADRELVRVEGVGLRGLKAPDAPIDCGNAGTLMRLIVGLLAGQDGTFTLTGDESLSSRPMERIAEPLRKMGTEVETVDGHAPITVRGGRALRPISYELPVASAQVKSCVLLAGLYASGGPTVVVERGAQTRDHTERLLRMMGARVQSSPRQASVWPVERLAPFSLEVPGDFSSAAPLIVAATLLAGSELRIHGVNLNPTRTGLLDVLERMGARIAVFNRRQLGGRAGGRSGRAVGRADGDGCRARRGAGADRRAAAVRARRGDGARRERGRRRTGVARKRIKSDRNGDNFPESPWHPHLGARRWLRGEGDSHPP